MFSGDGSTSALVTLSLPAASDVVIFVLFNHSEIILRYLYSNETSNFCML